MQFADLGPLGVVVDTETVPVSGRLAPILGTLLIHLDRRVSLDLLVDAVWGDDVPARAADTLTTHIWRLRRLLDPDRRRGSVSGLLITDTGGYRLIADAAQVDSARFSELNLHVLDLLTSKQPDRALRAADEALALWRGDPYDYLADRPWSSGPTGRLLESWSQLQERRVDALLATGRSNQALLDLEPLIAGYPLRERLWWQRILALHRTERTEEALQAFQQARRMLLHELGLTPGRDLEELHSRVLARDRSLDLPTSVVPTASNRTAPLRLPHQRSMLGREAEARTLRQLLQRSDLVTVCGPAGCGKTLLAVEQARAEAHRFTDGATFVDLSVAAAGSDIAALVASALDLAVGDERSPTAALADFAGEHHMLLVLDNCEQVLDEVAGLAEVLGGALSQVTLLATSREPLETPGERVLRLGPLALSKDLAKDLPLSDSETAVALFIRRAKPGHQLVPDELFQVRRVCSAVDGLPLAIELAGALAQTFTLDEVADLVERDPGRLAAVGRGQARHHQTLRAAIDSSYALLTEDEQVLHRRLAVLPGSFGQDLAEAVAGPALTEELPALLARVVHRSMLVASPAAAGTRFAQLAPIRAHAGRVLAKHDEHRLAEGLRDSWVVELVSRKPRVGRPEEADWYADLRRDLPTLRSTLHRTLVSEPHETGLRIVNQLTGLWYYSDLVEEGTRWARRALDSDIPPNLDGIAGRISLGALLGMRGRADSSRSRLMEALNLITPGSRGDVVHADDRHQQIRLAELLVAAANACSVVRDAETMRRCLDEVNRMGVLEDDPDLALAHEASTCLLGAVVGPTEATLVRAESVYARASAYGNLWAAWTAASSASALALERRDPELGQHWSRRVVENQGRLGATTATTQVETFGDFLAIDGQFDRAVQVFSATHQQSRQVGRPWPRNPLTAGLLEQCRTRLTPTAFNAAWAQGRTSSREHLLA